MSNEPLVISVVGPSGSGKTTVIEQLVASLRSAGLRIGTVKHASHGFDADREGSDSWRHQRAGAERVLLVGPAGAVLFLDAHSTHPGAADDPHDDLARLVRTYQCDVDVVLAEGYAPIHDLLIEVERDGAQRKTTTGEREVWITVTDHPDGVDRLGFDAIEVLTARIVARLGHR